MGFNSLQNVFEALFLVICARRPSRVVRPHATRDAVRFHLTSFGRDASRFGGSSVLRVCFKSQVSSSSFGLRIKATMIVMCEGFLGEYIFGFPHFFFGHQNVLPVGFSVCFGLVGFPSLG